MSSSFAVGSVLVMNQRSHPKLPWALTRKPDCSSELGLEMGLNTAVTNVGVGKHMKVIKQISHVGNKYKKKGCRWNKGRTSSSSLPCWGWETAVMFLGDLWASFPSAGCPDRTEGHLPASCCRRSRVPAAPGGMELGTWAWRGGCSAPIVSPCWRVKRVKELCKSTTQLCKLLSVWVCVCLS